MWQIEVLMKMDQGVVDRAVSFLLYGNDQQNQRPHQPKINQGFQIWWEIYLLTWSCNVMLRIGNRTWLLKEVACSLQLGKQHTWNSCCSLLIVLLYPWDFRHLQRYGKGLAWNSCSKDTASTCIVMQKMCISLQTSLLSCDCCISDKCRPCFTEIKDMSRAEDKIYSVDYETRFSLWNGGARNWPKRKRAE